MLAAVYLLWMFRKVMMGDINDATAKMRDVTRLEVAMIAPLVAADRADRFVSNAVLRRNGNLGGGVDATGSGSTGRERTIDPIARRGLREPRFA